MPLNLVITAAGRAALVNAQHDGTSAVRIARVGLSPTAIVATPATAALAGEAKRIDTIAGTATAADVFHVTVKDESAGVYTVRSFALYLSDGTLFAAYGQPDPIIEKSGAAVLLLALDVTLTDVSAAQISFGSTAFVNPAATTDTAGVVELATDAEAIAGNSPTVAVTPKGLKARLASFAALLADVAFRVITAKSITLADETNVGVSMQAGTGRRYWVGATEMEFYIGGSGVSFPGVDGLTLSGGRMRFGTNDVWHAGNDGVGSGLDADVVRGRKLPIGAWGTQSSGQVTGADPDTMLVGEASFSTHVSLPATGQVHYVATLGSGDVANRGFQLSSPCGFPDVWMRSRPNGWIKMWTAANDGEGSGLDADLLDGRQGSDFALLTGADFSGPTGISHPQGLVLKGVAPLVQFYNYAGTIRYGYIQHLGLGGDLVLNNDQGGAVRIATGGSTVLAVGPSGAGVMGSLSVSTQITRAGATVWDAGNDGAGSGLDADLLDGLNSSQFLRNNTGSWLLSEDGAARFYFRAGADTYARVNGAFRWQSATIDVASIDDTGRLWLNGEVDALRLRARSSGDGRAISIGDDAWIGDTNFPNALVIQGQQDGRAGYVAFGTAQHLLGCNAADWTLRYAGAPVWHAGNDGSGSGLDADLLDGWQLNDIRDWNNLINRPGSFQPNAHGHGAGDIAGAFAAQYGRSGRLILPNGLILQWTQGAQDASGSEPAQFVWFPMQFPNECSQVFVSTRLAAGSQYGDAFYQTIGEPDQNGVNVQRQRPSSGNDSVPTTPIVFAVGR